MCSTIPSVILKRHTTLVRVYLPNRPEKPFESMIYDTVEEQDALVAFKKACDDAKLTYEVQENY